MPARSLDLTNVSDTGTGGGAANPHGPQQLRVASSEILYVHVPAEADAPELMRARLRALNQGRRQFRQRVRKEPKPKPIERFAPIVSDRVIEAHEDV